MNYKYWTFQLFILSLKPKKQNCTYLQNAGYPSPLADTATAVSYTIQRSAEGIRRRSVATKVGSRMLQMEFPFPDNIKNYAD